LQAVAAMIAPAIVTVSARRGRGGHAVSEMAMTILDPRGSAAAGQAPAPGVKARKMSVMRISCIDPAAQIPASVPTEAKGATTTETESFDGERYPALEVRA
jgi:hypothetical protein